MGRYWQGFAGSVAAVALVAGLGWAAQRGVMVPTGTIIPLRMNNGLSSERSRAGDRFRATVSSAVVIDGETAIPAGAIVEGHVTSVEPARRPSRSGTIAVEFDRIVFADNSSVPIVGQLTSLDAEERGRLEDDEGEVTGESTTRRSVVFIGGGAGVGAAIGAIAGGGSGAGVGAGIGAGLGTAAVLLSRGSPAEIPAGFEFGVELLRPVRIDPERGDYGAPAAEALEVHSASALRRADGGIDIRIVHPAAEDGSQIQFDRRVEGEVAHVYVRGIARRGPATDAAEESIQTIEPAQARGVTRFVVHGAGRDITGTVSGGVEVDARLLEQRVSMLHAEYGRMIGVQAGRSGSPAFSARTYRENEIELYFALSSLASLTQLYEQLSASTSDAEALRGAAQAVVRAARHVDRSVERARSDRPGVAEKRWPELRARFVALAESHGLRFDRADDR